MPRELSAARVSSRRLARPQLEKAAQAVVRRGDRQTDMRARNRSEEIGVPEDERRFGENADDAGVRLTGQRLESAARESVILLGTLIGVGDRAEQNRGRASCPTQPG